MKQGCVDLKKAAQLLIERAREFSNLKKDNGESREVRLTKAKVLLGVAEELIKAARIQEADASRGANIASPAKRLFINKGQKPNRNIDPAQSSIGTLMGQRKGITAGDMGRCSRYCKDSRGNDVQGRPCPVCLGAGFSKGNLLPPAS